MSRQEGANRPPTEDPVGDEDGQYKSRGWWRRTSADARLAAVVGLVVAVLATVTAIAIQHGDDDGDGGETPPRSSASLQINNRVLAGVGPELRQDDEHPVPIMPTPNAWQESRALGLVDTGDVLTAECFSYGVRLTDGNDETSADDEWAFSSRLVYGVTLADGRRGYVHSVWSTKREDTLGLTRC